MVNDQLSFIPALHLIKSSSKDLDFFNSNLVFISPSGYLIPLDTSLDSIGRLRWVDSISIFWLVMDSTFVPLGNRCSKIISNMFLVCQLLLHNLKVALISTISWPRIDPLHYLESGYPHNGYEITLERRKGHHVTLSHFYQHNCK